MYKYKALLIPVLFAIASAAHADAGASPALNLDATDFAQQRAKIESALGDGKTYAEIAPADREKVQAALGRIQAELDKVGDATRLSEADRVKVFNDQEVVNTILTQAADDSRVSCRRETQVGSHRAVTHCTTVAERRRRAEATQQDLQQMGNMQRNLPTGE